MNTILELISDYGVVVYGLGVFFGGRWGLKFFSYFEKTRYNFLLFATIAAIAFILAEVAAGTFRPIDFGRYLLTYTVVTSCYELFGQAIPFLKNDNE